MDTKGEYIYCATSEKQQRSRKWIDLGISILVIVLGGALLVAFSHFFQKVPSILESIVAGVTLGLGIGKLRYSCTLRWRLEVYTKGIFHPYRGYPYKGGIREEKGIFIPFTEVEAIYLNEGDYSPSWVGGCIVVKVKNPKLIPPRKRSRKAPHAMPIWKKPLIKDVNEFEKVLKDKVKIVKEVGYHPNKGEIIK